MFYRIFSAPARNTPLSATTMHRRFSALCTAHCAKGHAPLRCTSAPLPHLHCARFALFASSPHSFSLFHSFCARTTCLFDKRAADMDYAPHRHLRTRTAHCCATLLCTARTLHTLFSPLLTAHCAPLSAHSYARTARTAPLRCAYLRTCAARFIFAHAENLHLGTPGTDRRTLHACAACCTAHLHHTLCTSASPSCLFCCTPACTAALLFCTSLSADGAPYLLPLRLSAAHTALLCATITHTASKTSRGLLLTAAPPHCALLCALFAAS